MLDYWRDVATAAQGAARFSFIRATGEMPSVLDHPDGRAEFFRYESLLTAAVSALPEVVVCLYDLGASARRYSWILCGPIPG